MRTYISYLSAVVAFSVSTGVLAQVYETRDAEGNPSFSDSPTEGSEQVDIGSTNTMEPAEAGADPGQSEDAAPSGPTIRIVNEQPAVELNEGRRVILDSDEYDKGMANDPRQDVVPLEDVETDLVDDQGREIDPKKDLPYEGIHVIRKGHRN